MFHLLSTGLLELKMDKVLPWLYKIYDNESKLKVLDMLLENVGK